MRKGYGRFAVFVKQTDEGWIVVNDDTLDAAASNCSPVAFEDYIAIAHSSRYSLHLYYTIWDDEGSFRTTDFGAMSVDGDNDLDLHSATMAFGNGYVGIAFSMHTYGSSRGGGRECQNQWGIGV